MDEKPQNLAKTKITRIATNQIVVELVDREANQNEFCFSDSAQPQIINWKAKGEIKAFSAFLGETSFNGKKMLFFAENVRKIGYIRHHALYELCKVCYVRIMQSDVAEGLAESLCRKISNGYIFSPTLDTSREWNTHTGCAFVSSKQDIYFPPILVGNGRALNAPIVAGAAATTRSIGLNLSITIFVRLPTTSIAMEIIIFVWQLRTALNIISVGLTDVTSAITRNAIGPIPPNNAYLFMLITENENNPINNEALLEKNANTSRVDNFSFWEVEKGTNSNEPRDIRFTIKAAGITSYDTTGKIIKEPKKILVCFAEFNTIVNIAYLLTDILIERCFEMIDFNCFPDFNLIEETNLRNNCIETSKKVSETIISTLKERNIKATASLTQQKLLSDVDYISLPSTKTLNSAQQDSEAVISLLPKTRNKSALKLLAKLKTVCFGDKSDNQFSISVSPSVKSLRVGIVTWNVAGLSPISNEIAMEPLFLQLVSCDADVISIGLQEMVELKMSFRNIRSLMHNQEIYCEWEQLIVRFLPQFKVIYRKTLVGLQSFLLINRNIPSFDVSVTDQTIRLGKLGLGNKGSISFCLSIKNANISFSNCHFAAGATPNDVAARFSDLRDVLREISPNPRRERSVSYFLFGDLNFRLRPTISLPASFEYIDLQSSDEWHIFKSKAGFLQRWSEAEISFPPTYKYFKGTKRLIERPKCLPAWTDRVLYNVANAKLTIVTYRSVSIQLSDHMPVLFLGNLSL